MMTLSVIRIVVSWSESPRLFVNALFLNFDEGFFKPQKGQLSIDPDISFLQFGQRSDVLTFEGAISRFYVVPPDKYWQLLHENIYTFSNFTYSSKL